MKTAQPSSTYRRLLTFVRPYWRRLVLGFLCGLLYAAVNGAIPSLVQSGINFIGDPDGAPTRSQVLGLDMLVPAHAAPAPVVPASSMPSTKSLSWMDICLVMAILPLIAVLRGMADYGAKYFILWTGHRAVVDIRNVVFDKLLRLPVSYFTDRKSGETLSRAIQDTALIEKAVSTTLEDLAKQPLTLVAMIVWVFFTDWRLALISVVVFPLVIVPVALFGRRARRFSREAQERIAEVMAILQESVAGARIIRAFGAEDYERGRFGAEAGRFFGRIIRVMRASISVEPVVMTVAFLGLSVVLVYIKKAGMGVDQFMAFAVALLMMYEPVKKLAKIHVTLQQSNAAGDRIFELLDAPVFIAETEGAPSLQGPIRGVEFESVTFTYGDDPVLREISFTVREGDRIAFVGSSGSGKTTLVNLIPRFYDVTSGRVIINGRDVKDWGLASLRKQIGLVSQDTFLFNDTVANNIRYGSWEAAQGDVEAAAQAANAAEFIARLPQGYNTVIGDRGMRLSGGQCQRLAIARAMLRNPPILILDEATSALDTESERLVQDAIDRLMTGRTVFAIAHRLSTIIHCTQILVLEQGRIVERGTHTELLARNGVYRRLHDLQAGLAGE